MEYRWLFSARPKLPKAAAFGVLAVLVVAGLVYLYGERHFWWSGCWPKSYLRTFNDARRTVATRQYRPADVNAGRGATWVYVVARDLDSQTEVHMVQWEPKDFYVLPPVCHRVVTVDGVAVGSLLLLDTDGDGHTEAIIEVAGADNAHVVILDFSRPKGKEIMHVHSDWPPEIQTQFADLDGDERCEMIKVVPASRLRDIGQNLGSQSPGPGGVAYMVYRLHRNTYELDRVSAQRPTNRPILFPGERMK